jgi:hypothetical protein
MSPFRNLSKALVKTVKIDGADLMKISTLDLSSGMYFCKVSINNVEISDQKLIIVK